MSLKNPHDREKILVVILLLIRSYQLKSVISTCSGGSK